MKANAKFFGWASIILLIAIVAIILFVPKRIEEGKIKTFARKDETNELEAVQLTEQESVNQKIV